MYEELTALLPKMRSGIDNESIRSTVYSFCEKHKEDGYNQYESILERSGLKFDCEIMANANVSELDGTTVVALLMAANRKWYWCGDSCYEEFVSRGCLYRWIKRLLYLDEISQMSC